MHILQSHSDLHHPLKDLVLTKYLIVLLLLLDVMGQIANLAVLHHNGEGIWAQKALFVFHNVGMVQILEQSRLPHAAFLLAISQPLQDHLLGNVVLVLLTVADDPRRPKIAPPNTVLLLILRLKTAALLK